MATTNFGDGMCYETSGFLFSHPCDRFSIQRCVGCQKPICEDHGHDSPEGIVCTTCLKKQKQAESQTNQNDQTTTTSDSGHTSYSSDPYFYGHRYYPGYGNTFSHSASQPTPPPRPASSPDMVSGADFDEGDDDDDRLQTHDPADFTEGDAGSLEQEEDADFESDMGAS